MRDAGSNHRLAPGWGLLSPHPHTPCSFQLSSLYSYSIFPKKKKVFPYPSPHPASCSFSKLFKFSVKILSCMSDGRDFPITTLSLLLIPVPPPPLPRGAKFGVCSTSSTRSGFSQQPWWLDPRAELHSGPTRFRAEIRLEEAGSRTWPTRADGAVIG